MNSKVTSKDSLKSEGLDTGPCHQHLETLSRDAVPLRRRIGIAPMGGTTVSQRSKDIRKVKEWGHRGIERYRLKDGLDAAK